MSQNWWVPMIQWGVWGVVMSLVMGWLAKSRFRRQSPSEVGKLIQPVGILIVGIVCFAFFASIAVVSNTVGKNNTTSVWTTVLFIGFALMGLPMVADYFWGRHVVSENGMSFGKLFGSRGNFQWSDVKKICYSNSMKWFRIELNTGETVRVSAMLVGLSEFAKKILENVPRTAFEEDAYALLQQITQGQLPNIWA